MKISEFTNQYNIRRFLFLNYRNGRDILPPDLLTEIQKYLSGELIYIPKKEDTKASWGSISGSKTSLNNRNQKIAEKYINGTAIIDLQKEYCLSEASIRKIIYQFSSNQKI